MPIDYRSELPATADLVIIGGGIVGAATAYYAARAGLSPLLLERRPALCAFTCAGRLVHPCSPALRLLAGEPNREEGTSAVAGRADIGGPWPRMGMVAAA